MCGAGLTGVLQKENAACLKKVSECDHIGRKHKIAASCGKLTDITVTCANLKCQSATVLPGGSDSQLCVLFMISAKPSECS